MSPEQLQKAIKRCQQTGCLPDGGRQCLLCGDTCPDEAMFVGLWIPPPSLRRRIGCSEERIANGGTRTVLYQVCPTCFERPSMADEVDNTILQRVSVQ